MISCHPLLLNEYKMLFRPMDSIENKTSTGIHLSTWEGYDQEIQSWNGQRRSSSKSPFVRLGWSWSRLLSHSTWSTPTRRASTTSWIEPSVIWSKRTLGAPLATSIIGNTVWIATRTRGCSISFASTAETTRRWLLLKNGKLVVKSTLSLST